MQLTDFEREMVDGHHGEATAVAMSVMIKLGEAFDAEEMVPISSAHIDGAIYRNTEEVSLVFAERLAKIGAKVRVPTTLSMGSRDIERWRDFRQPPDFADGCKRMENAYLRMGTIPAWTCAPYMHAAVPRFGEHIAWAESNAIVYANSVIGARTARYGDFADICAAIVGRVPRFDLHLSENRLGRILITINSADTVDFRDDSIFPLIGYVVGKIAPDGVPVIEGIPKDISTDQLKALGAAAASSGNIALFHIVGATPEAATREQAFGGHKPQRVVDVGAADLADARKSLTTTEGGEVDLVTIGCPHASFMEIDRVLLLLDGGKIAAGTEFWITTNRAVYGLLEQTGKLGPLQASGVKVMTDSCIFTGNYQKYWKFKLAMTNSAKFAHYAHMGMKMQMVFGTTHECVQAALSGAVRASHGR